jgi:hypothetical protein
MKSKPILIRAYPETASLLRQVCREASNRGAVFSIEEVGNLAIRYGLPGAMRVIGIHTREKGKTEHVPQELH